MLSSLKRRMRRLRERLGGPKPPQELLIIATQRTGSNFMCECLRGFSRTFVLLEIFHGKSVQGINAKLSIVPDVARRLGVSATNGKDPVLVEAFRNNPARAWAALADTAAVNKRALLAFKIFDRQLPVEQLAPILKSRKPAVLFLVRSRLDVYISYLKARTAGKWFRSDTTDTRPDVAVDEFLAWSAAIDRWYADTTQAVADADLKSLVLRYEDHIRGDKEEVVRLLQRALAVVGVKVALRNKIPPSTYFKQDKVSTPFEKLGNGAEVKRQLIERGHLDYALDAPLSDRVWNEKA